MQYRNFLLSFLFLSVSWSGCQSPAAEEPPPIDYQNLPALTASGFNAVVEIPAGTNQKVEYRTGKGAFEVDQVDGRDRVIRFLPYPGNYGFIPSTHLDAERGGDGDPLDVLVIGESRPTGAVLEAIPIGVLRLRDRGEIDDKIIAVPADSSARTLDVTNFRDFLIRQDPAKRIIEEWFLNYKGLGAVELVGWEDEHFAMEEIRRWSR